MGKVTMKIDLSPTKTGELYTKWLNLVEEVKAFEEKSIAAAIELSMSQDETERLRDLLEETRGVLQQIYSQRGEDELIQKVCSPMIDRLAGV